MFMRRRPLMAAAVVGGVAYHAGKVRSQAAADEDAQNQQIADLQAQQAQQQAPQQQYAEPAPAAPAAGGGIGDQLTQLKGLLDSGVLSQEEFDAAKAKALAGG
jgi:hypothetical protein